MSYGKITEQELSDELRKKISEGGSGECIKFIPKGDNQTEREPGVFYLVEVESASEVEPGEPGGDGDLGVEVDPEM